MEQSPGAWQSARQREAGSAREAVLIGGSHPDQWARFGLSSKLLGYSNKVASVAVRFGVFRLR